MTDYSGSIPLRGVMEAFYGTPWPMSARLSYARWLSELGLNCYLYAPKADPYLRRAWSDHWPAVEWRALTSLSAEYRRRGVAFGVGLSPFSLYADYSHARRARLRRKIKRLNALEAPVLGILFDDMPGDQPDLAARQAEIVHDCSDWSRAQRLLVCPTYYSSDPVLERVFGTRPADYWQQLGTLLPDTVDVFWTGPRVCADALTASELSTINTQLARPVTVWDNYPVNDSAQRSRHLYLEPPPRRAAATLRAATRGHLCNGMNQPLLSLPAIAGLAGLYDPALDTDAWLSSNLGSATLRCLRCDASRFRDSTREQLCELHGEALRQKYLALETPAANEVLAWLDGDYVFDPACLTD